MTLLEMIIALAILGIIFTAVLPQFRVMFNSWDSKQASAEILQNGRVLVDHLNNNLSKAVHITSVSPAAQLNGFIEFKDIADVTQRYDVAAGSNYVQFGTVGNLSELAGPVSKLQFTCYDVCDIATTDVTKIRYVKVDTTFTNPSSLRQSKTFTTQVLIRANYQDDDSSFGIDKASLAWFEYDPIYGGTPALCQIDNTHYLCAYEQGSGDGWAVVLSINPMDWNVSRYAPFEFDDQDGHTPDLVRIDNTHYLCAYEGPNGDGWAVVLQVNPVVWTISKKTPFEFDMDNGMEPALAKIDDTHYLCAYRGKNGKGWAVVLEINPLSWSISSCGRLEFDSSKGWEPVLAQIDSTHYLCVYRGPDDDGWAAVLEVDPVTWNISKRSSFEYDVSNGIWPALVKIDNSHYLCAYGGPRNKGFAVILTVNTNTWAIGRGMPFEFDTVYCAYPALTWLGDNTYICAYGSSNNDGVAIAINVSPDNWTINKTASFIFDSVLGREPAIVRIDNNYCLVGYRGRGNNGWSGVLRAGIPILP